MNEEIINEQINKPFFQAAYLHFQMLAGHQFLLAIGTWTFGQHQMRLFPNSI